MRHPEMGVIGRRDLSVARSLATAAARVVSIAAVAGAQTRETIPMVEIAGGAYPMGSADGPARTWPARVIMLGPS